MGGYISLAVCLLAAYFLFTSDHRLLSALAAANVLGNLISLVMMQRTYNRTLDYLKDKRPGEDIPAWLDAKLIDVVHQDAIDAISKRTTVLNGATTLVGAGLLLYAFLA
jgi:hypothetical protein